MDAAWRSYLLDQAPHGVSVTAVMRRAFEAGYTAATEDAVVNRATPPAAADPAGHEFVGVAGHPDDDECTHQADGASGPTYLCQLSHDGAGYLCSTHNMPWGECSEAHLDDDDRPVAGCFYCQNAATDVMFLGPGGR